jgi:hypothetical protein
MMYMLYQYLYIIILIPDQRSVTSSENFKLLIKYRGPSFSSYKYIFGIKHVLNIYIIESGWSLHNSSSSSSILLPALFIFSTGSPFSASTLLSSFSPPCSLIE